MVKNLSAMQDTQVLSLGQGDFLEKKMATHASMLVWEIPWTKESGGLQSMGSQRVEHNWATNTFIPIHFSSLIPRMSVFTLAISCLTTSHLPWFMDLIFQVPMPYCSLQHWTWLSPLETSTSEHLFHFGLAEMGQSPFILSGAVSSCPLLFPGRTLDTFWPGGLIFQCHIFLFSHTVHGAFAHECWSGLPLPVDHIFSEIFTMTHPSWLGLHSMTHSFIYFHKPFCHDKAVIHEGCVCVCVCVCVYFNICLQVMRKYWV